MNLYTFNFPGAVLKNDLYRKVVYTKPGMYQLVFMSLLPGEDIPMEKHDDVLQKIRVEDGSGLAIINNKEQKLKKGSVVIIAPGVEHYIKNILKTKPLKLSSEYIPPEHKPGKTNIRQP